jgi:hypothetical protein
MSQDSGPFVNPLTTVSQTSATGSAGIPSGTTAQRDGTPAVGYSRYNSTLGVNEYWGGAAWEVIVDAPILNSGTLPASFTNTNTRTLNSSFVGAYHNALINADFGISQVNASSAVTVTAAAALQYVIDQWYAYSTGANVTGQRVAGAGSDQYCYQFTGAASVTAIGFAQRIEAENVFYLNGQTAIVGIDLANSLLTTVTWVLNYANTADTFGTLASPTVTQIATGTFTVNSSVTRYYTPAISIPGGATTGLELKLTVGAQTSGTWTIGKGQLEQVSSGATVGTAFERVPYATQLAWCQRYLPYWASLPLVEGYLPTAGTAYLSYYHPVPTRVPPTGATVVAQTYVNSSALVFTASQDTLSTRFQMTVTAGGVYYGFGLPMYLKGAQL